MAGKRGRKPGFKMSEAHRTKIANSQIFKHLMEHAQGTRDMTPTQVTVGLSLMDRVMPKLSAIQLSGDDDAPIQTVTEIKLTALKSDDAS